MSLKLPQIRFMEKRKYSVFVSIFLVFSTFLSIALHDGLNYGIDFRGGTNVQVQFQQTPEPDRLRDLFETQGMNSLQVQTFGDPEDHEVLLGLPIDSPLGTGEELTSRLREMLSAVDGAVEIRRVETIGPKVGDELKQDAMLAVFIALGLVLVYISFRFEWRFGVSAIVCLLHDVLAVVGVFSLFDREFSLAIVAALLTVVGYSLNDTIVVFDRVRENLGKFRKRDTETLLDLSINETLSRTLLTSLTTLLVVIILYTLGGEIIHDFAFALLVGVIVGTFSSIYVASPTFLWLQNKFPAQVSANKASAVEEKNV
jgi:preprotein translocase subunit SecF